MELEMQNKMSNLLDGKKSNNLLIYHKTGDDAVENVAGMFGHKMEFVSFARICGLSEGFVAPNIICVNKIDQLFRDSENNRPIMTILDALKKLLDDRNRGFNLVLFSEDPTMVPDWARHRCYVFETKVKIKSPEIPVTEEKSKLAKLLKKCNNDVSGSYDRISVLIQAICELSAGTASESDAIELIQKMGSF